MSSNAFETAHRLLSHLPAIYRDEPFTGQYLWAFEQVLLGLEKQIDDFALYFDPATTEPEFLPWLASWVALTLRADLNEKQQRAFLARIVSFYQRRGTKECLQELLSIFTVGEPTIVESTDPGQPHFFRVIIRMSSASNEVQQRQRAIAKALIDLEKPAHTDYNLDVEFPTMQIGVTSTVGIDTLLGTSPVGG